MACDRQRARLRMVRNGALCVALSLLLLPWAGTAQEDSARVKVHVVQRGETLTRIAGIHGVTVPELREWNGIKGTRILVGQELRIRAELEYYRVKTGDTLGKIAKRFYGNEGQWRKIFAANRSSIPDQKKLKIGIVIEIPR